MDRSLWNSKADKTEKKITEHLKYSIDNMIEGKLTRHTKPAKQTSHQELCGYFPPPRPLPQCYCKCSSMTLRY